MAVYALRHGNALRVVIGVGVLANTVNLLLVSSGFRGQEAPFLGGGASLADPLVQALVLTAIVIGFGVTSFALVLSYVLIREEESTDVDAYRRLRG